MQTEALHKKKLLAPKLRFKEFNDDWKIDSLTNLYSEIVVGFVGTVSSDYCDESEGVQFVRTLNVKDGWFSNEGLQYVSKVFHFKNKKSQVKNGDILIARVGANMGLVCEISGLIGEANSANVIIIKHQANLSSRFYASYLSSSKGQKQIQSKGAGGAQEVLNISVAKTINIPFLSLPEQQKIASFLSAVDEKIQQLTRKKELLEQYKKGVMQQLFSGKLRFKDENGKAFAKWEETELGKHIDLISGFAFKGEDISEKSGGIPLMRGINITEGYVRHSEDIDRYFHGDASSLGNILLKEGDLVLGMDGSKVGKNSAQISKNDEGSLLVQRVACIRSLETSDISFIYQHIRSPQFIKYVDMVNTSSGIPHISSKQIRDFKILFPVKEEQKKIANYLSSIDNKIEIVNNQITQTQTFKKGLLQQMFV